MKECLEGGCNLNCCILESLANVISQNSFSAGGILHPGTCQIRLLTKPRQVTANARPIKVPEIVDRETALKPQQLREYFERIGLPEQLQNERRLGRLDLQLLEAIIRGHVTHIPFENLSLVGYLSIRSLKGGRTT